MKALYPDIITTVGIIFLIILELFLPSFDLIGFLGFLISFISGVLAIKYSLAGYRFSEWLLDINVFSLLLKGVIYILTSFVIFSSVSFFKSKKTFVENVYTFLLISLGLSIMVSSKNLAVILAGLELASISMYISVGMLRDDYISKEASFKYLVLGSMATAFFGIGSAFYIGATSHLDIISVSVNHNSAFALASLFLFVAFALKVSAAPFHFWTPDAYEGAPTSTTAFISTVPKIGFYAVIFLLASYIFPVTNNFSYIVGIVGVISMFWGNLVAYAQNSAKRMLAYSSIGHAGYFLIGFSRYNPLSVSSTIFYVIVYAFATAGAFLVLSILEKNQSWNHDMNNYRALYRKSPFLATALALFLFALIGIPPFATFVGKLGIFLGLVNSNAWFFAILFVIGSIIAAGYYLKLIVYMFFKEPVVEDNMSLSLNLFDTIGISAFLIIVFFFGIFPNVLFGIILKDMFHG
ncbi:MAG: NADH-quinone oxidoreductase subunit N [Hydrogenobaculum sp.]